MINNLKAIRELQHINQKDLAAAIGVTPRIMYEWEQGSVTPSIRAVLLMAHFLNIPVDRLYSIEDEIKEL